MTDFPALLRTLSKSGVEYILVGGAAATAHGASRLTVDIDIVYRRTHENLSRIVSALAPHRPYLRGAPPDLPFHWDPFTLERGLNFTLSTTLGDVDLFGELTGGGTYERLAAESDLLTVFGVEVRCLSLDQLIDVKRAAGRPKDLEAIAELEAIREERHKA